MKSLIKTSIALATAWLMLNASAPLLANKEPSQQGSEPGVKVTKSQVLGYQDVAARIDSLVKTDAAMAALAAYLQKQGYTPQRGSSDYFGADIGFAQQTGERTATITVVLQNYASKDQKQQAALAMSSGTSGKESGKYGFALFKNAGEDLTKSIEYRVDDNLNVVKANSWLTCVSGALFGRCSSACLVSARLACMSPLASFARFFNCVFQAAGCVGCMFGPMACCTCNCGFFCAWATGCCRHS